jgi:N-acetylglucosamine-6-sulfatase
MASAVWLALTLVVGLASTSGTDAAEGSQARPNVVQVMTDDQTVESLRVMPNVRSLLAEQGVTFDNYVVNYSLCCPSRATWLTGQYAHNHGVRGNEPPSGGYAALDGRWTLPVWLQRAGYYTAHVGKYLNGYGSTTPDTEIPPGWTNWEGALDDPDDYMGGSYTMYGYTLNENGSIVHYGSTPGAPDPATYQTDVYSAKAEEVIRDRAPLSKPFYLSVAPLAPHYEGSLACTCAGDNPRAAPRHQGNFSSASLPRPPSFNEADVSDKPAEIRNMGPMAPVGITLVEDAYRERLESLLAVDEMVQNIVDALGDTGELDDTVVIFTSDNGFFQGEHRIRDGKVRLYEEAIKVPMIVRGPGFPRDVTRTQLTSNVDLAPTILDLADAAPVGRSLDGVSLLPLAADPLTHTGRAISLEAFFNADGPGEDPANPPTRYRGIRTDRYLYVEHGTSERELYDLRTDPFQLSSLHASADHEPESRRLAYLLHRTQECDAAECRRRPSLTLGARFRRGKRGCIVGSVRARVLGRQEKGAASARFFVRTRELGADQVSPLARKVGSRRLRRGRRSLIRAIVTMLDGRQTTISRIVPRRC